MRKIFSKLVILFVFTIIACAGKFRFPLERMQLPPGGYRSEQVPQFVVFGNDDISYSGLEASGGGGGIHYLTELFAARRNPDGQPLHYSFYVNTKYITPEGNEDPALVKQAWKEAIDHGHEIGVHTHSHPHGREFSVKQWETEMQLCLDHLTSTNGVAVDRTSILGFRTPFIEYNDNTLKAARKKGFTYDCSIEEGFQSDADGRNFVWPYKLDHGSPGNAATYELLNLPPVRKHPGLWEIPAYAFLVPPDPLCEQYGVPAGLRSRLKKVKDYFQPEQGKITGFDWNLWYEFGMNKAEFLATLKYSLDQRLQGNRSPMTVGIHSDIYADRNPEAPPQATVDERREALREFLDYALSKPEVRVVSARELLRWIESPVEMRTAPVQHAIQKALYRPTDNPQAASRSLGAGFRCSIYAKREDPGPRYWARVGKEMAARWPGATPEGIWIVGSINGRGTRLPFPVPDVGDPLITGSNQEDPGESALNLFDRLGFRIWIQIEPRFASVEKLIDLVLQKYSKHPCVVGLGIDVEWYKSIDPDKGDPISDENARKWLAQVRSYNPEYRMFLKHWEVEKMPPTVRDGFLFVDDSQIFPSMEEMVKEFAQWGKTFAPAPVAFQYGYPSDKPWWSKFKDPPKEIGDRILQEVPNTEGLYWVDFSVLEVFPPNATDREALAIFPNLPLPGGLDK